MRAPSQSPPRAVQLAQFREDHANKATISDGEGLLEVRLGTHRAASDGVRWRESFVPRSDVRFRPYCAVLKRVAVKMWTTSSSAPSARILSSMAIVSPFLIFGNLRHASAPAGGSDMGFLKKAASDPKPSRSPGAGNGTTRSQHPRVNIDRDVEHVLIEAISLERGLASPIRSSEMRARNSLGPTRTIECSRHWSRRWDKFAWPFRGAGPKAILSGRTSDRPSQRRLAEVQLL